VKVLTYSERADYVLELLGCALNLDEKGEVATIAFNGEEAEKLAEKGFNVVYLFKAEPIGETVVKALIKVIEEFKPELVLLSSTKRGREAAAYLSSALDSGCVTEAIKVEVDNSGFKASRLVYGGRAIAVERVGGNPPVIAVHPGVCEAKARGVKGTIEERVVEVESRGKG